MPGYQMLAELPDIYAAYADLVRPPADDTPSEFALKHRKLHEIYCVETPGPWRHDKFPYQPDVQDVVKEAIETGKSGVVLMKAGQIGGTDCCINSMCWLKEHYPGPQLFLTSTEDVAEEFGRERFDLIFADMAPLRKKLLGGKLLVKRFTDGKWVLCGGQSVFKLQSTPYRFVGIDEVDSLVESLGGEGDPIALAEIRTNSFLGETLIIAWAHPTIKSRGAGKLYYEQSDQRRGFVTHLKDNGGCGHEFWLDWFKVVKVEPRAATDGQPAQTMEQAEKDPDCYHLVCPGCGNKISEAERVLMLRAGVRQKSTLPPEAAAKKPYIGVHASQLYSPKDTIRKFAVRWIATDCGRDEATARVFVNKVLGDVYEPKVKEITIDALRKLAVIKRPGVDPEFYSRGQVPPWVLFLTAGQDSRHKELHFAVWGWGVRETVGKSRYLCGALIDYGEIKRQTPGPVFTDAEYHVFDDVLYRMQYPCSVGEGGGDVAYTVRLGAHDIGYQPTQIPIIRYCRSWPGRARPCKGASEDHSSASLAEPVRKGAARRHKEGDAEVFDDPQLVMNTYLLKEAWYGMVDQRIVIPDLRDGHIVGERTVSRLVLPENVTELWLEQSKNEKLVPGEKSGELVWEAVGANHIADCNTYAYGCALDLDPHARNRTAEEYGQLRRRRRMPFGSAGGSRSRSDPSLG